MDDFLPIKADSAPETRETGRNMKDALIAIDQALVQLSALREKGDQRKSVEVLDLENPQQRHVEPIYEQLQQLSRQLRQLRDQFDMRPREDETAALHVLTRRLQEQLDATSREKADLETQLKETQAKYRAANARFRSASQEISALKAQKIREAPSKSQGPTYRRPTAPPARLDPTGKARGGGASAKIWQGLNDFKSKVVIPVAKRLGLPHSKAVVSGASRSHTRRTRIRARDTVSAEVANVISTASQQMEFVPPSAASQEIGILGWPGPPDDRRTLVLAILDEFTEGCFASNVRLLQPRPDNWFGLAQKYPPAAIFVESAWRGNGGSWQYRVGTYNVQPGQELAQMIAWARSKALPTVFWNKEDPVHHEKFMKAASLVDHIFTTDQRMVESYEKRTGKRSVHALPFAAQPALHKPAPLVGRLLKSCFAGSWYGDRHAERGEAMKWLLRIGHSHGLDIFDRNLGNDKFQFPSEYRQSVRGNLPYLELCREYSHYRVFLNVNSVTDSPTMFSRRVFELLACGTPIVSTYASGIEEVFESKAVWLVRNEVEADEAIRTLLTDDREWRRRSLAGIREVFSRHTYAHRLNSVFQTIGLSDRIVTEPKVLLLARARGPAELDLLFRFADNQKYGPFTLLIESDEAAVVEMPSRKVRLVPPGELINHVRDRGDVAGMGWIAARHTYGPNYLADLVNAMTYRTDAQGWAKAIGDDEFAFGGRTRLAASIWRPHAFLLEWLGAEESIVADTRLFCADTDEFKSGTDDPGVL